MTLQTRVCVEGLPSQPPPHHSFATRCVSAKMREMPGTLQAAGLATGSPARRSTGSHSPRRNPPIFADPCKKKGQPTRFQINIPGFQRVLSPGGDRRWYLAAKWSHQVHTKQDFPRPCSAQPLNTAAEVYQKQMRNDRLPAPQLCPDGAASTGARSPGWS